MGRAPSRVNYIFKLLAVALAIISTPLIIIGGSIGGVLSWLSFYVYRELITCIAKCTIPNARILWKFNHYLALGEEYTSTQNYITAQLFLEGRVNIDSVTKEWTERIINKLNPNEELQFPELQDYLHTFGGYSFRRRIEDFNVQNYIHLHHEEQNGIVDKLKLLEIRKKFQAKLFREKHPLWEILIVNNYRHNNSENDPECTAFIFKNHHVIADGSAVANLFYNLAGVEETLPKTEKIKKKFQWRILIQFCKVPVEISQVVFEWTFNFIYNRKRLLDTNAWHPPDFKLPLKYETWLAEPVDKTIFRQIRIALNVSTMSVILNVICGGMRQMMLAKGLTVPKEIRVEFPVLLPNHPGTLTNHASIIFTRIPFTKSDCKEMLLSTDNIIKEAAAGIWPTVVYYGVSYMHVFPTWIKRIAAEEILTTAMFSCVNLNNYDMNFYGHKFLSCSIILNLNRINAGCHIGVMGYGDYFHITIQLNNKLLNHPDEVKELEKYILEELTFLANVCLT